MHEAPMSTRLPRVVARPTRVPSAPILLSRLAQADDDFSIPIDVENIDSPRADLPARFRERLALALRTTDAFVLDAAERAYQGTWPTLKAFLLDRLAVVLGTRRAAMLAGHDCASLLHYYASKERLIWSIPSSESQHMVFELPRRSAWSAKIAPLVEPTRPGAPAPVG